MTIILLLLVTIPITFLWLNVDKILIHFGQHQDISTVAKTYISYLIPDLFVTSLFCPLKSYLSSQSITLPTMFSSAVALAFHIPINIVLSKTMGLEGVSMAVWITDLIVVVLLAIYVAILENRKGSMWKEGGWWDQSIQDWIRLLKLCGSCCLNTCLEWWCYEILILLTGHLTDAKDSLGVLTIVLNFDYLLFSVMLSLATCVSTRVSNELFSQERGIITGVKRTMLLMALVEVFNFPVAVCGGILHLGLIGLFIGLIAGIVICLLLLLVFIARINWEVEASKAQQLATKYDSQEPIQNHHV
ncbi:hypothetical protein Ahy_Scaffold1g106599 isoform A [Arachis hypogaea]|uniref:Protein DETOXIFICATION n=1 Tax=Arachis hypogaea TaxID=3818 RepID=A0A444WQP4_ARAHY|nr:hypothetical protein Ahy_Scaffold1g106599 isoform A [Arachis hypogaea]